MMAIPPNFSEHTLGVAAGVDHICGIDKLGSISCWGNNSRNQCDIPAELTSSTSPTSDSSSRTDTIPLTLSSPASTVIQADAGTEQTCAVSSLGKLFCWGSNQYGQTSIPSTLFDHQTKSVSTGGDHTCGIDLLGKIVCWGNNLERQCNVP
mmetsp:Transcript_60033/g.50896  ORF Transcript_60033/g.50896 Transcript_60033/m.50896 type:complete len:151 (-) Transcript_60033:984-1436(-)